jgi:hypothetical protein
MSRQPIALSTQWPSALCRSANGSSREQQEAIRELSTPVFQVRERLLILPIIGVIDPQDSASSWLLGSFRVTAKPCSNVRLGRILHRQTKMTQSHFGAIDARGIRR